MAASEGNFILEMLQNNCFSKTAAEYIYFKNSRLQIFYISYFDIMFKEGQIFMDFFEVSPHKKISEILPLDSGIIVVLSNK